jgi:NAD(P)-dependent dehydrogenase (short-subunit alcohol dehydrogenase family)
MNVVVTGASKGIGFDLAKQFALAGHQVFALARSTELLARLENETNSRLLTVKSFDLRYGNIKEDLTPHIASHLGHIDILVNNAGILVNKPFLELTDDDFDLSFEVNAKSAFRLIRDLFALFADTTHIVNIGSMGGYMGSAKFPGLSVYSAAKGALAILSECLAEELKDDGIKVNTLAIGAVQTEMLAEAFPGYEAPVKATEMASFIMDFCLNGHRFFNGKVLPVSVSTP